MHDQLVFYLKYYLNIETKTHWLQNTVNTRVQFLEIHFVLHEKVTRFEPNQNKLRPFFVQDIST